MKKNLALLLFIGLTSQIFGQLNPVNNLTWEQWYQTPRNFFDLNWESPDSSVDTLIGYNIYREHELFRFQTESELYNTQNGENCPEDFLFYGVGGGFWIHVTAVYNSTNAESNYIDSAFSMGLAIGMNEIDFQIKNLFPNPTTGILNINYESVTKVIIINQSGKILKEFKQETQINLSDLLKGVYIVKVITDHGEFVDKIILE